MNVQRTAFWLNTDSGPLFTWLHSPPVDAGQPRGGLGVIICNPIGHEYTHSHRSLRHLADACAEVGFPTLRFDYHGTGNSDGTMLSIHCVDVWLDDIQAQIAWLKRNTEVRAIALVGLRFGATLAALATARQPIDYLVSWSPCVKGKRYARELVSLSKMAAAPTGSEEGFVETAGFLLSTETLERIKAIDLTDEPLHVNERVLILNRDDISADDTYANYLKQKRIPVDTQQASGYLDMLAEPQDTRVPYATITSIVDWLARQGPSRENPKNNAPKQLVLGDDVAIAELPYCRRGICESLIIVEQSQQLFGILTRPDREPDTSPGPLIVLSNSGAVHHVGPNRLYVELSRSLAKAGFDCFRYDLGNLGDSCCRTMAQENHPYPPEAVSNLAAVLDHLQNKLGYQAFILAGLCSGSHVSFHAGLTLRDYPIVESVLINPLTFYWRDGMSLDIPSTHQVNRDAKHYEAAVRDLRNWMRLFKGQVDVKYLLKFTIKLFIQRSKESIKNTLERLSILPPSQLGRDLLQFKQADRNLSFIFSRSDPGYKILLSEAKLIAREMAKKHDLSLYFIEDADHTFSKQEKRSQLTETLIRHLQRYAFQTSPSVEQQF